MEFKAVKEFEGIKFKGVFRDYQQRVLDNFERHAEDHKIHIVASPGSGKTVLGLEIVRRLGLPALILSPSITIRQQWGDRFEELFCNTEERYNNLFSYDIRSPKLLTSITYQALYSAVTHRLGMEKVEEDDPDEEAETINFKGFDLLEIVRKAGIKTICLDEAHHLKAEWQRAIEKFMAEFRDEIYLVALTATPPYDSKSSDWERYESLCGEIDDEIFVPQLVAQKSLCPHQDYVYFNYPTEKETQHWLDYRTRSYQTVREIISSQEFSSLILHPVFSKFSKHEEFLFEHIKPVVSVLTCLNSFGINVPQSLVKFLLPSCKLPFFQMEFAEIAFQFIIEKGDVFGEEVGMVIREKLATHGFIIRNNISLQSTDKLRKEMSSSLGKLNSIVTIVNEEFRQLRQELRMLILTDFIKSDLKHIIGSDTEIGVMGTVTIFESLRRAASLELSIALLSGRLVIVHQKIVRYIRLLEGKYNMAVGQKDIPGTEYCELIFNSSNKYKVALLTELFQSGHIQVMIGTKSLLGEGWDAPCINSLILASFVGSFVLSNQMRGRAIRIDPGNPAKTANIWHLVTVNPDERDIREGQSLEVNSGVIHSGDYEQCCRKFENFIAPAYHSPVIESGIGRCDIIKPPFEKAGFEQMNKDMLVLAGDRKRMQQAWETVVRTDTSLRVVQVEQIPAPKLEKRCKTVIYTNAFILSFLFGCLGGAYQLLQILGRLRINSGVVVVLVIFLLIVVIVGYSSVQNIMKVLSPGKKLKKMLDSLLVVLQNIKEITSPAAQVELLSSEDGLSIQCGLIHATRKEMLLFSEAVREMLSAIDNPRYVLVREHNFFKVSDIVYMDSYACPSVLGVQKKLAEQFVREMQARGLTFKAEYTRNSSGRRVLLLCRKNSICNRNTEAITGKKIVKAEYE